MLFLLFSQSYFHPNLEVLVITNNTTPENTCNVIDLLHQANEETAQENRFKIYRCKPEDAEQLSCQRDFDVMFTDVDFGISNEMIRIIVAIRYQWIQTDSFIYSLKK